MTHYTTGKYRIDIYDDQTFIEGSAENITRYDFVNFDKSEYHFPSVYVLKVFRDNTFIKRCCYWFYWWWDSNFEIHKYQNSYIIRGEFEISRLDKDGKIPWQQDGADIFTTLDGKDNFAITNNYILATDWKTENINLTSMGSRFYSNNIYAGYMEQKLKTILYDN